jgi:hypothetical protein
MYKGLDAQKDIGSTTIIGNDIHPQTKETAMLLATLREVCPDLCDKVFRPADMDDFEFASNVMSELLGDDWRENYEIEFSAEGVLWESVPQRIWPRYVDCIHPQTQGYYRPIGERIEPVEEGCKLPGKPGSAERVAYYATIADIAYELDAPLECNSLVEYYA